MSAKHAMALEMIAQVVIAKTSGNEKSAMRFFAKMTQYLLDNFDGPSSDPVVMAEDRRQAALILDAQPKLTGPQLLSIMRIDPPIASDVVWQICVMRCMVGVLRVRIYGGSPYDKWALRFANVLL